MQNLENNSLKDLYRAISLLKTEEECAALFADLCTMREVLDMAQRLETAKKLAAGENYQKIAKETGMSTATISRVSRCLQFGSGGYGIALRRLEETEEAK